MAKSELEGEFCSVELIIRIIFTKNSEFCLVGMKKALHLYPQSDDSTGA